MNLVVFKSNRILFFAVTLCVLFSTITQANKLHELLANTEKLRNLSSSGFNEWLERHASVSVHEVDEKFGTPFQMATLAARLDLMVDLIERDVDIDARNAQGETALYLAIKNLGATRPEIVITLINLKANLALRCNEQSYGELAEDLGLHSLVEALKRGPMYVDKSIKSPVIPNDQITFGDEDELSWEASSDEERAKLTLFDPQEDRAVEKEDIKQEEIDDAFEAWELREDDEGLDADQENQLTVTRVV